MRYRLFHKPTRTVRADRYATEADAYAALGKMPFTESADYFVVIDEAVTHDGFTFTAKDELDLRIKLDGALPP